MARRQPIPKVGGGLFNPATPEVIRQQTNRTVIVVLIVATLIFAGLAAGVHHEYPFVPYWLSICPGDMPRYRCEYDLWLDFYVGLTALVVFGLLFLVVFKVRRLRPTVRCERCSGRGWIVDLKASDGRCPLCGNDRFAYFIIEGSDLPRVKIWQLRNVGGLELLARQADNRNLL